MSTTWVKLEMKQELYLETRNKHINAIHNGSNHKHRTYNNISPALEETAAADIVYW